MIPIMEENLYTLRLIIPFFVPLATATRCKIIGGFRPGHPFLRKIVRLTNCEPCNGKDEKLNVISASSIG